VEGTDHGLLLSNIPALGYLSGESKKSHENPQTVQPVYKQGFEKRTIKHDAKMTSTLLMF
jgi:hypothetical protein